MNLINELYQYRELLKNSIKKEIRGKYKGSILGVLWSFLNPLLTVLVYALIFPYIMGRGSGPSYLLMLITGVLPWTAFTTAINQGTTSIRANEGIVKKVYFPREILPISVVVSALINFLISCIIILIFCIIGGAGVSAHLLWLPIPIFLQFLISLGIAFASSAINVYVKDLEYIIQFVLNLLFYGSAIIFQITDLNNPPSFLKQLIEINPITQLMQMYRNVFINHQFSPLSSYIYLLVVGCIVFGLGLLIFRKLQKRFAEEL